MDVGTGTGFTETAFVQVADGEHFATVGAFDAEAGDAAIDTQRSDTDRQQFLATALFNLEEAIASGFGTDRGDDHK